MRPLLSVRQGHIIRALAAAVLDGDGAEGSIVVERAAAHRWSSLTFVGERHEFVLRFPCACRDDLSSALEVPGALLAIERAEWTAGATPVLAVALLAIDTTP